MRNVLIFCQRFYDKSNSSISIGGIQTYIANLCQILKERNLNPIVFQYSNENSIYETDYCTVYDVDVSKRKHLRYKNRLLFGAALNNESFSYDKDIAIFATESLSQKKCPFFSIAIQHGISWDIQPSNKKFSFIYLFKQMALGYYQIKHINYVDAVVCVDYNYLNWYRTQTQNALANCIVIPNFTEISSNLTKSNSNLTILFARRLQPYRGTRLFTSVIKRVLDIYDFVNVIIAGDGPDEKWMKSELQKYNNVKFTKYDASQSLNFHRNVDIAVVPTVGSEGTSLSLLEAMASNCAVVCTNVGGMTNIVIDEFNGLIVNPNDNELFNAICYLIDNPSRRKEIALNGFQSVKNGFSFNKWKRKWNVFLDSIIEEKK